MIAQHLANLPGMAIALALVFLTLGTTLVHGEAAQPGPIAGVLLEGTHTGADRQG